MPTHHLAQLNIAKLRAPTTSPLLADFMSNLAPVNAIADASPGFVWRLQGYAGNATDVRGFGDDVIVNMSVWESVEALKAFMADASHLAVMRRRHEWFHKMESAYTVLWWIEAGHIPTVEEAKERLALLDANGPTPEAFSLRQLFPRPTLSPA